MENDAFKQLASGEAIEARQIYGRPFTMEHYAKLLFSTNELPKEVEQTNGYFRRWLIVPFDVTIPEGQQDKELAQKIIQSELAGVFNWVLKGVKRLLRQKKFTACAAVTRQLEEFKRQSDNVQLFLEDGGYRPSANESKYLKELFLDYRSYCTENGYRQCSTKTFSERLRNAGYTMQRKTSGNVVFIQK
jgi:putative DNA primase/helicase